METLSFRSEYKVLFDTFSLGKKYERAVAAIQHRQRGVASFEPKRQDAAARAGAELTAGVVLQRQDRALAAQTHTVQHLVAVAAHDDTHPVRARPCRAAAYQEREGQVIQQADVAPLLHRRQKRRKAVAVPLLQQPVRRDSDGAVTEQLDRLPRLRRRGRADDERRRVAPQRTRTPTTWPRSRGISSKTSPVRRTAASASSADRAAHTDKSVSGREPSDSDGSRFHCNSL